MAEPGADWVAGAYATWLHRGIWVPLCLTHPDRYVLTATMVATWRGATPGSACASLGLLPVAPLGLHLPVYRLPRLSRQLPRLH